MELNQLVTGSMLKRYDVIGQGLHFTQDENLHKSGVFLEQCNEDPNISLQSFGVTITSLTQMRQDHKR
ncbi:unnamed protein product [Merluccius merluccius]